MDGKLNEERKGKMKALLFMKRKIKSATYSSESEYTECLDEGIYFIGVFSSIKKAKTAKWKIIQGVGAVPDIPHLEMRGEICNADCVSWLILPLAEENKIGFTKLISTSYADRYPYGVQPDYDKYNNDNSFKY